MDVAFAASVSLPSRQPFSGGLVCSSMRVGAVHSSPNARAALRMIGATPSTQDPEEATGDVPNVILDDAQTEGVSEAALSDESESPMDFPDVDDVPKVDPSKIETLSMPQPFINASNIEAARVKFRLHDHDTGSPEYQVATLTTKIAYLTEHLKNNRKDHASTRGLLKMVATRRRLLKFVKQKDPKRFDYLVTELGIRVSANLRSV